jgi:hypothetical protein
MRVAAALAGLCLALAGCTADQQMATVRLVDKTAAVASCPTNIPLDYFEACIINNGAP